MTTTAATAKNRRARVRAVKDEQKRIRGAALEQIRKQIEAVSDRRRDLLRRVRGQCHVSRERVQAAVKQRRLDVREQLRREVAEMRQAERNRCALRLARVNLETESALERKRRELREQREAQAFVRRVETHSKKHLAKHTAAERRAESDDAVRSNIEAELVPVFDVVKAKVRARPGMSRTEAFLHWVEEHESEVWSIRERQAEAQLNALLREERRATAALRKCGGKCEHPRKRARPAATAAELAAVPF
jgi:hypothetical protein